MTNFEKIKEMSIDELAEEFVSVMCADCNYCEINDMCPYKDECIKKYKNFLARESDD